VWDIYVYMYIFSLCACNELSMVWLMNSCSKRGGRDREREREIRRCFTREDSEKTTWVCTTDDIYYIANR